MERLVFQNSEAIISQVGAYVVSLALDGKQVLQSSLDNKKTHGGLSLLIPYADLVYGAKYEYEGVEYTLPRNAGYENDFFNSIHGLTNNLNWTVKSRKDATITLTCKVEDKGLPSTLRAYVRYSIKSNVFKVEIGLKNTGRKNCPVMVGAHPYFISDGDWEIQGSDPLISLNNITDKEFQSEKPEISICPSNTISYDPHKKYDDSYFGGGTLFIKTNDLKIELRRTNMPFFSVYNGKFAPNNSFSIVPITAAPNSFNNKFGLKSMAPKETFRCGFVIKMLDK